MSKKKRNNNLKDAEIKEKRSNIFVKILAIANSRYVIFSTLLLVLLTIGVRYAETINDNDIWWHMKYGEYMVKHLTLKVDHSIFSWTVADPNWVYNTPFSQIYFYLAYKIGGIAMLHITQYAVLAMIIGLFLYYSRLLKQSLSHYHILAILMVAVLIHLSYSNLRPEIFSHMFMAITIFIYFYVRSMRKNIFYLYPILFFIWVNTHGVFVFGIAFISIAFAGELINYLFFRKYAFDRALLKHFFIMLLLSYGTLVLNPYGINLIVNIVKSFTDPQFLKQASMLVAYKSVFKFGHPAKYLLVAMVVSYIIFSVYIWLTRNYFNFGIFLINAVFIYISLKYGRSVYYYPLVWYFSMFFLLSIPTSKEQRKPGIVTAVILMIIIVFSAWTVRWAVYYPFIYRNFGFGIAEHLPVKTAEFLKQHKLEGPMYNTYEIGGYLLWALYPEYKVFVDPRHGPYVKNLIDDAFAFDRGEIFEQFTARYPFKIVVVKLEWIYLFHNFFKSPDWRLVYFDQSAAVFVHKSVKLPDTKPDLSPERFKDCKTYEAFVYTMYAYANINDFKSAWYIMNILKSKYNYGYFRPNLQITEGILKELEARAKNLTGG